MEPIVSVEQMRAIDAAAPEPVEVLIDRAGSAVARAAIDLMGGAYGRTVNVIAGPGNNGADGRVAADRLSRRGVRVRVIEAAMRPPILPAADLVVDAAYGTGFRGEWVAPDIGDARVLAVDIPSGLDATTGAAGPGVLAADRTVTFQALKPGLLLGRGPELTGEVIVVGIGLDVSSAIMQRVERSDVGAWWPRRQPDAHKWRGAVRVVAGSASMQGAAWLASRAALRSGAGIVSLTTPQDRLAAPPEVIADAARPEELVPAVMGDIARFGALLIGPGLGRHDDVLSATRQLIAEAPLPAVIDGDAIFACAWSAEGAGPLLQGRHRPTVLTPHDGEFRNLMGSSPGDDRLAAVRDAADELGVTILLKGPTTIIAGPATAEGPGETFLVDHGDDRLATPGSGDVLAGMIAAGLANGADPTRCAAAAAWLHADAARQGPREGLVAGDLIDAIPPALAACRVASSVGG